MFDGSAGKSNLGSVPAAGIVVYVASTDNPQWTQAAQLGIPLPPDSTSMFSETIACTLAVKLTESLLVNLSLPTLHQIHHLVSSLGRK